MTTPTPTWMKWGELCRPCKTAPVWTKSKYFTLKTVSCYSSLSHYIVYDSNQGFLNGLKGTSFFLKKTRKNNKSIVSEDEKKNVYAHSPYSELWKLKPGHSLLSVSLSCETEETNGEPLCSYQNTLCFDQLHQLHSLCLIVCLGIHLQYIIQHR